MSLCLSTTNKSDILFRRDYSILKAGLTVRAGNSCLPVFLDIFLQSAHQPSVEVLHVLVCGAIVLEMEQSSVWNSRRIDKEDL